MHVFEELQFQYQPNINNKLLEPSHSNSATSLSSRSYHQLKVPDSTEIDAANQYDDEISKIISLTQQHTNNDNNYFYNYYSSNLREENNACDMEKKITILGLLNDEYPIENMNVNELHSPMP